MSSHVTVMLLLIYTCYSDLILWVDLCGYIYVVT